ncbi:hypothetical protein LRAMOSA09949 [Lichtheimia ramosa]|uniref:G-protein coupled receptors family 3 profile domain-containing protein n=1 Tax=Lichtheimia ramosa TaxID=688394 RepID=A0A077WN97_9FUNG|nr:hypothetical protein LRAMOSA09949 [Lichtheimia ramosa]
MSFLNDDPVEHTNVGRIAYYTDEVHNYEFRVEHKNGSTVISPREPGERVELKIGILLPFHQTSDNVTRELTISGTSAIRMAAAEINTQQRIPGAYVTLIEKDSFPQPLEGQEAITQAVVSAISLVQQGVIGVIGDISSSWTALSALITSTLEIPQCSFTAIASSLADRSQYSYFYRTIPTDLLYADAALSFVATQGWPYISLLYSNDDYGNQLSQYAVMKAKSQGILINGYQSFYGESDPLHQVPDDIDELLSNPNSRIVFVVAQDEAMTTALIAAANKGYMNSDHVWISLGPLPDTTDIQSSINDFNSILKSRQQGQTHQQLDWYANSDVASESLQKNQTGNSMRAIDYIAWTTPEYQQMIDYPTAFSGGIFSFALGINLTGYGPFDQLQHTWSQLDPQLYPFAGNTSQASSNVAMAYSCLWSMADGFRKIVSGSSNMTQMLNQLVTRQLGDDFTPTAFNTGDNGPDGPMIFNENGDRAVGNFRVLNLQHGQETQIGTIFGGKINITETPVYYGGSLMAPTGLPAKTCINPGYHTPISLVIVAFTAFGMFMALLAAFLITIRRRHLVSSISSVLSCLLELLGFLFLYTSVFFFSADRTLMDCFVIPVTFHIGYTLLLGCLSLKLYRIYAVHNNIYLKKPIVTDRQLIRVCLGGLIITGIALVIWLPATEVQTISVPVTLTTYFVRCDYEGGVHSMLVALITLVAALFLLIAVMLAIRTRAIPKNKPKYAECRHISLAI